MEGRSRWLPLVLGCALWGACADAPVPEAADAVPDATTRDARDALARAGSYNFV